MQSTRRAAGGYWFLTPFPARLTPFSGRIHWQEFREQIVELRQVCEKLFHDHTKLWQNTATI